MNKNVKKVLITAITLTMCTSLILSSNNNTTHSEYYEYGDDTFYIIDENGDPVVVSPEQEVLEDLKEEEESYDVVAVTSEDENEVIGTYDNIDDAQNMYNRAVAMTSMSRTTTSSEISILSSDSVVATTASVKGIVRFKRTVKTNSSGTSYVANINYTEVETGRAGYINPSAITDAAYISTETDGIVCKMSGVIIKVDTSDVQEIETYSSSSKVSYYYVSDGYLIHYYTYYNGTSVATASTRVGYKPSYLSNQVKYYSYDGHYFYKSFNTMISDYQNSTYENSVNSNEPYYNYYQYLSLRSNAVFTGEQYNDYITSKKSNSVMATLGDDFVNTQNKYTINSVLMIGVAINESGWGTSSIAKNKNNLFGLNAVDSNTGNASTYYSLAACIEDWAYGWMSCGYLNGTDSRYRGPHLGDKQSGINVKYASDPYWGEKGSSRSYYMDTTKSDYGRYTIGIASTPIIKLYKEANTSKVIYTSEVGNGGYLYDYPMIILDTVTSNGETYYKIQSDMALKDDRSSRNVTAIYDADRDYVYAKASEVNVVFGSVEEETPTPTPSITFDEVITHLSLTNTNNYLTGFTLGTNISKIIETITNLDSGVSVVVKKADGTKITSGTIATGMTITLTINNESQTYTIVIKGDASGDGKISALDYVKVRNHLDGATTLTTVQFKAADVNNDNKISALDYVKVRNHLDGKSTISQ